MSFDWNAIAARIRGLVHIRDESDIPAIAARLGVSEASLRMSVEKGRPLPTLDVIAAIVRIYGLDPSWVLTGDYDSATHRDALNSDTSEVEIMLQRLLSQPDAGPSAPDGPPQTP